MNYGKRKLPPPLSPDDGSGLGDESVKRKFRNLNEKKRRDQFNLLISELAAIVCSADKKQDKTTILEQAIKFLESYNKNEASEVDPVSYSWKPSFLTTAEFSFLMLEAMDCITLSMDTLGKVSSVSDNVEEKLGISQEDLLSQTSLSEMLSDPSLISRIIKKMESSPDQLLMASCLLQDNWSKAQRVNNRYRLVDLLCVPDSDTDLHKNLPQNPFNCVIQTKTPCYSKTFYQHGDTSQSFKGRYSMEWKILQLDSKSSSILGYQPFEIMGTSGYLYYHPEDTWKIADVHKRLLDSGCCKSPFYRMSTKSQGWVWLQTEFYVSFNQWSGKREHIEALHRLAKKDEVIHGVPIQQERPYSSRVRTPSPANPQLQPPRVPVETGTSSRLFESSIRPDRDIRVGRLPPERLLDNAVDLRMQATVQSMPALIDPQFLSPAQLKLHSQLQAKYEELKNHIASQQAELEALASQLNLATSTRRVENPQEIIQSAPLWNSTPQNPPGQLYPPSSQPGPSTRSQRLVDYNNPTPSTSSNFPPAQLDQFTHPQQNCNQQ